MQESVTRYGDAGGRKACDAIRSGLASIPGKSSCGRSAVTCIWITPPWGDDAPRRPHGTDGQAGSILITTETLRLAEGYIRATLGPVPVKGLDAPVEVFELVGASGIRRRLRAGPGSLALSAATPSSRRWCRLLSRRGPDTGVVAVVGEAGVGKSRLAYEFLHSHHTQGWRVLESSSVSYGNTPTSPCSTCSALCLCRRARRPPHHPRQSDPGS